MLVQPGRPNENKMKKATNETQRISHKLKKSFAAQKCTNCGQLDHNKRKSPLNLMMLVRARLSRDKEQHLL